MGNLLLQQYTISVQGVKQKTIFHFSDCHLSRYDSLCNEEEIARAKEGEKSWTEGRKGFADGSGEPWGPLQEQAITTHFSNLLAKANEGDAVILTGDIMDYISGGNVRALEQGLTSLQVPFLVVCGNHDMPEEIPEGMLVSRMKQPVQVVDLGDLLLVGLDNSKRQITTAQLKALEEIFAGGKKVILAMHVPIMTEDNRERLMKCGTYFQLNYDGCPQENNDFVSMITAKDSPVIAVLTGHLHFQLVSDLGNGIYQYGVSQGVAGNLNQYRIGDGCCNFFPDSIK